MSAASPHKRILTEKEFGRLFAERRTPFIRVAASYVHDTTAAEDLVNESFMRLWERRDEIRTDNFEAYLFQIVVRKCLDHLKSEKTQKLIRENMHRSGCRMLLHEINSLESCDPRKIYEQDVERLLWHTVEHSMSDLTRRVFLASRMQDKTYQEIADELGIPVRQVTAEIQSALQLLRHALKDYLPFLVLLMLLDK